MTEQVFPSWKQRHLLGEASCASCVKPPQAGGNAGPTQKLIHKGSS